MSERTDPWDAMVQTDDSDEDYLPSSADGIDEENRDFEEQSDNYDRNIDEDDLRDGDELGPCMFALTRVTLAKQST